MHLFNPLGAQIENMVNQAALQAVLDGTAVVKSDHLEYARDKIIMGENDVQRVHRPGHLTVHDFSVPVESCKCGVLAIPILFVCLFDVKSLDKARQLLLRNHHR